MGINKFLSGIALAGVITPGVQAGEQQNPTMMESQIGQAIALCHAVNAKAGTSYNCTQTLPTIKQRGKSMIVSQQFADKSRNILDIPLVTQYAEGPNMKASFTWHQIDLSTLLKK